MRGKGQRKRVLREIHTRGKSKPLVYQESGPPGTRGDEGQVEETKPMRAQYWLGFYHEKLVLECSAHKAGNTRTCLEVVHLNLPSLRQCLLM